MTTQNENHDPVQQRLLNAVYQAELNSRNGKAKAR